MAKPKSTKVVARAAAHRATKHYTPKAYVPPQVRTRWIVLDLAYNRVLGTIRSTTPWDTAHESFPGEGHGDSRLKVVAHAEASGALRKAAQDADFDRAQDAKQVEHYRPYVRVRG